MLSCFPHIYIFCIRVFHPSDSSLTIWSLGQLASFPQQSKQGAVARSAKIIWDSLMRRAEQQLTRVKVDIIRCHSHFLPKTQWIFPPLLIPFPLVYSPPKATVEKEVSISDAAGLWRFLRSLVNAAEIVALMSRFVLYSFFFSSFLFFQRQSDQTGQ